MLMNKTLIYYSEINVVFYSFKYLTSSLQYQRSFQLQKPSLLIIVTFFTIYIRVSGPLISIITYRSTASLLYVTRQPNITLIPKYVYQNVGNNFIQAANHYSFYETIWGGVINCCNTKRRFYLNYIID